MSAVQHVGMYLIGAFGPTCGDGNSILPSLQLEGKEIKTLISQPQT